MSAPDVLLQSFAKSVYEFADAACDVWPNDHALRAWRDEFRDRPIVAPLYEAYNDQCKAFVAKLLVGDETVVEDMFAAVPAPAFLTTFDVRAKLNDIPPDVRATCWVYIKNIVQSASMASLYEKCPPSMMSEVSALANELVESMANGNFDLAKLNPADLTEKIMAAVNKDEVEIWAKQVSEDKSMENIANMFTSGQGGAMFQQMAGSMMGGELPPGLANLLSPDMIKTMMSSMALKKN